MAKGAMGDANMELKQVEKAAGLYLDAAEMKKNEFTSPLFLMKSAMANEELGKYDKAVALYKRIKEEFPRSKEGREIDKYISYAEGMIKK